MPPSRALGSKLLALARFRGRRWHGPLIRSDLINEMMLRRGRNFFDIDTVRKALENDIELFGAEGPEIDAQSILDGCANFLALHTSSKNADETHYGDITRKRSDEAKTTTYEVPLSRGMCSVHIGDFYDSMYGGAGTVMVSEVNGAEGTGYAADTWTFWPGTKRLDTLPPRHHDEFDPVATHQAISEPEGATFACTGSGHADGTSRASIVSTGSASLHPGRVVLLELSKPQRRRPGRPQSLQRSLQDRHLVSQRLRRNRHRRARRMGHSLACECGSGCSKRFDELRQVRHQLRAQDHGLQSERLRRNRDANPTLRLQTEATLYCRTGWWTLPLAAIAWMMLMPAASADRPGTFVGRVVTQWEADGRQMTLLEPFNLSMLGKRSGASRAVSWSMAHQYRLCSGTLIGGPFEGKYRVASIIHDYYRDVRSRPWQDVHRVFYEAMLASGVSSFRGRCSCSRPLRNSVRAGTAGYRPEMPEARWQARSREVHENTAVKKTDIIWPKADSWICAPS